MSTTSITSWKVDLANIGAIYPFAGYEVLMLAICVISWLAWHRWCQSWEKDYHDKVIKEYHNKDKTEADN